MARKRTLEKRKTLLDASIIFDERQSIVLERFISFSRNDSSNESNRRTISRDDLDDFEMLHITSLWRLIHVALLKAFHDLRFPFYLYDLLASADIFHPLPVSSFRSKNQNIEVFGHCPILTVPPYLRAES